MQMDGPWQDVNFNPKNSYLYNGKELNEELGLNWLSFGFREYDPAIGRFPSVDPIADEFGI
jgi:RHS repeat-associated protein